MLMDTDNMSPEGPWFELPKIYDPCQNESMLLTATFDHLGLIFNLFPPIYNNVTSECGSLNLLWVR